MFFSFIVCTVGSKGPVSNSENSATLSSKYPISLDPNITKRGEVRNKLYDILLTQIIRSYIIFIY